MRFVLVLLIALAAGSNALQLRNRAFVAGHNLGATVSINSGKYRGCTGVVKKYLGRDGFMFVGIVKSMVAAQAVNARITREKA